jgi:anti-anti-sigma factor
LNVEQHGDTTLLHLAGELDGTTETRLDAALASAREGGADEVILDMRRSSFIDSQGVRMLIKYDVLSRKEGFRFAVVPGTGQVLRVLKTLTLDRLVRLSEEPPQPAAPEPPPAAE